MIHDRDPGVSRSLDGARSDQRVGPHVDDAGLGRGLADRHRHDVLLGRNDDGDAVECLHGGQTLAHQFRRDPEDLRVIERHHGGVCAGVQKFFLLGTPQLLNEDRLELLLRLGDRESRRVVDLRHDARLRIPAGGISG